MNCPHREIAEEAKVFICDCASRNIFISSNFVIISNFI
jgi:hypothetical protein